MQTSALHFTNFGPPLDGADLDGLEAQTHWKLPGDYRKYLLDCNGGQLDPYALMNANGDTHTVTEFLSLLPSDESGIHRELFELADSRVSGFFPIAWTTNNDVVCFSMTEIATQVWLVKAVFEDQVQIGAVSDLIAPSFTDFVAMLSQLESLEDELEQLARCGGERDIDQYIVAGGNLDAVNHAGQTLLLLALKHGNLEVVEYCISRGASLTHSIHYAVHASRIELIPMLIQYGADVNELDVDGCRPIEYVGGMLLPGEQGEVNRLMRSTLLRYGAIDSHT